MDKLQKLKFLTINNLFILSFILAFGLISTATFMGYENNKVVLLNPDPHAHYLNEPSNKLSILSNWDGPNYLNIEQHGYTSEAQTNFFPLYPLIIYVVNQIIVSPLDSALLVSWFFFVLALYYYLKIVKEIFHIDENLEAVRAIIFFMFFPSAIFLIATYTESLFAALALSSIYYAIKNKYLLSAVLVSLATLTHINGVFVTLLIALILYENRLKLIKIFWALVISSIGLLSYMFYLYSRYHNALAFLSAQKKHGWLQHTLLSSLGGMGWLNIIMILLILVSAWHWWNKKRSFAIYSLLFLIIPIVGGQFGGFNRYVLMEFPVQLMLYDKLKNTRYAFSIALIATTILWTYFVFQYAGGYVGG